MSWKSKIVVKWFSGSPELCDDHEGAFVHLFNKNTSWHGHTVMCIEYINETFWTISFEPAQGDAVKLQEKLTGAEAKVDQRTNFQDKNPHLSRQIAGYVTTYVISKEQHGKLREEIDKEIDFINKGKGCKEAGSIAYAILGNPIRAIRKVGYRDTCYSWPIRVLRNAGIISPFWCLTRWFSLAPAMTWFYSTTRPKNCPERIAVNGVQ